MRSQLEELTKHVRKGREEKGVLSQKLAEAQVKLVTARLEEKGPEERSNHLQDQGGAGFGAGLPGPRDTAQSLGSGMESLARLCDASRSST